MVVTRDAMRREMENASVPHGAKLFFMSVCLSVCFTRRYYIFVSLCLSYDARTIVVGAERTEKNSLAHTHANGVVHVSHSARAAAKARARGRTM